MEAPSVQRQEQPAEKLWPPRRPDAFGNSVLFLHVLDFPSLLDGLPKHAFQSICGDTQEVAS